MDKTNMIMKRLLENMHGDLTQSIAYSEAVAELDTKQTEVHKLFDKETSDKVSNMCFEREQFGFAMGFLYAMQLAQEDKAQ